MKVLILGNDGYIGFPLSIHLMNRGHRVLGIDNLTRRKRVGVIGGNSLTPIEPRSSRKVMLREKFNTLYDGSYSVTLGVDDPNYLKNMFEQYQPDAIIHLAEQPSAPWSMKDPYTATQTQQENVIGTLHILWSMATACPKAHLIKLGTLGEYGTPNCDIPEGVIPNFCLNPKMEGVYCPMKGLLFPRRPGSFYHVSKVMDTINIEFCCRNWGLRSTDIMQGVLFGINHWDEPSLVTRFDYDEYFGTVINRFVAQALSGIPLTVYGKGNQTRGYLPLQDSIQCLTIALENPPSEGEYRTLNQFEQLFSVNDLAEMVCRGARLHCGINASIQHIENPRLESEDHYYNPDHQKLFDLGYVPTDDFESAVINLIKYLAPFKDSIIKEVIMPKTNWRRDRLNN